MELESLEPPRGSQMTRRGLPALMVSSQCYWSGLLFEYVMPPNSSSASNPTVFIQQKRTKIFLHVILDELVNLSLYSDFLFYEMEIKDSAHIIK